MAQKLICTIHFCHVDMQFTARFIVFIVMPLASFFSHIPRTTYPCCGVAVLGVAITHNGYFMFVDDGFIYSIFPIRVFRQPTKAHDKPLRI